MAKPVDPSFFGPGTAAQADRKARQAADAAIADAAGKIQAATAGQGFTLHEGDARDMLDQAYEISDKLTTLKANAESLQRLTPPAADQVSMSYNKSLTSGDGASVFFTAMTPWAAAFDAGVAHIDAEIYYVNTMIDKLEKALGVTRATEGHNTEAIGKAGTDTTGAGQQKGRF